MSIRTALFTLVLLAVIPAFLLIGFSATELKRAETLRIEQDMKRLTQNLTIHQDGIATASRQLLATLAQIREVRERDSRHCSKLFQALLQQNPQYVNILAADPQGMIFADAHGRSPISVADRKYFREALRTANFSVGEFAISRSTKRPVLHFALPVFDAAGALQVVLIIGYDLSYYDRVFSAARLENATLVLSDHQGTILHRSTERMKYEGKRDILIPYMAGQDRGQFKAKGLDGTRRLYSFTSLRLTPESAPYLYLRVGADDKMTFALVYRHLLRDLAIILVGALLTIMLALMYGNRRIAKPLTSLIDTSRQIADGNLVSRDISAPGISEIRDLAQAFTTMGAAISRRDEENARLLAELRQREEHYRIVADFTVSWEYWLSNDGTIAYMSPSAKELTGYEREDFVADPNLLFQVVHPEDRELWQQHRQQCEAKPGTGAAALDLRIITSDNSVKWLSHVCQPVYDAEGRILGRRAGNRDISDRKRAEQNLVQLNAELEERVQERTHEYQVINRELESFCYAVSHDLRAPARHINSYSSMILEDFGQELPEEARHHLERVIAAAGKMGELIDGLLNLSRLSRGDLTPTAVNLSLLVAECLSTLQRTAPERQVLTDIAPDIIVEGDGILLKALIDNLVGNAWKFTAKTPAARIEFGRTEEARGIVYYLRDNGAGFDMAYANKLFQPFQRLHRPEEFEGSGIGLATVQRIIHRHGGQIWGESSPSEQTTFYFTLP